ncbi:MAG: hypothetical protein HQQ74_03375 [Methanoculleus bourgensis]|jgi:hypothetical protein|uniref:Uncharacterized protein n=1 Tax=Methanoculleus bourgensis TaxID=83986 RepID=A0A8T7H027_9EURY|nr:hypothetical protein [Methanoculleus sp. UBA413]NQS77753.1 hypothetical protein [Methanoculleus bourgensis]SAI88585.1 hypothetical protein MBBA_1733 [Methanoculleus bourgensis]
MKRRTAFGIGAVLLLLMAVALPASAAGPWGAPQADEPTGDCPGCGHYQHQNSGGQPDEPAGDCDRDRIHLRDGSCGACPNR